MADDRRNADLADRERNRVSGQDVGTAASASVEGRAPTDTEPAKGISAAGGATGGAVAGGTAGLVTLGPIGAIIGAIAGAVGGGWAGLATGEQAEHAYSAEHDAEYRRHYEAQPRLADRSYDDARVAYQLGHFAATNPDYRARPFEDVEPELRRGWTDEVAARHGSWEHVREYARAAYHSRRAHEVGRGTADLDMGGTASHRRASFADPIPADDPDGVMRPRPESSRNE